MDTYRPYWEYNVVILDFHLPTLPNPYSKSTPLLCPVAPDGVIYPKRDTPKETTTGMRKPMLDPQRDLAGATPETLARALLRRTEPLRPDAHRKKEADHASEGVLPTGAGKP